VLLLETLVVMMDNTMTV
jgi:hypothetical protein